MLLRGLKLPPPALDKTDIEVVKSKGQRSGRGYGGAPLGRGNYSGSGRREQFNYGPGASYGQRHDQPNRRPYPPNGYHQGPPYGAPPPGWQPPPPGYPGFGIGMPPPPPARVHGGGGGYGGPGHWQQHGNQHGPPHPPRGNYSHQQRRPPRGRGGNGYGRGYRDSRGYR